MHPKKQPTHNLQATIHISNQEDLEFDYYNSVPVQSKMTANLRYYFHSPIQNTLKARITIEF